MSSSIARLLFVSFLALVATVARGEERDLVAKPPAPVPVLAGMGFDFFPELTKPKAVQIIFSDDEVDIVELSKPEEN